MPTDPACDYVIVGSGAGGGTLAARLAEAGMRVVLLEAGPDARDVANPRMPGDYDVPAFHAFASENPAMSWDFFVRHTADEAAQLRDPNHVPGKGIFYPRASTLGGCTAHNAMIMVRPHDADWDGIATLTGDASWQAARMNAYFRRVERCRHRPLWRWLRRLGIDPTGHGWDGWLQTEHPMPQQVFEDGRLLEAILRMVRVLGAAPGHIGRLLGNVPRAILAQLSTAVAAEAIELAARSGVFERWRRIFDDPLDPNDVRTPMGVDGLCYTPLSTRNGVRTGVRERLLDVAARHPDRLRIETGALATRVLFDAGQRAVGVAYLRGDNLYRAHAAPNPAASETHEIRAAREVVLCGGAFNTPQLLMLSGVGPADALAPHGIAVRIDLPGVGRNLQDRYEIGVVNRMAEDWESLAGARFEAGDPLYEFWARTRGGMYASNGAVMAVARRSTVARKSPDLFCMALLARFAGYVPGYSRAIAAHHDYLSWIALKAHTRNRAGRVTLRSGDPRDMPAVDFHSFDAGDDETGADLRAVVEAIRFIRTLTAPLKESGLILGEELPGEAVQDDAALAQFVRDRAWGHHASCSCAIGPREAGGVLDSAFRVHGTRGLRVVDASVFPRIPGFFIASAIYMVAEKAADVMLADAPAAAAQAPAM